MKPNPSVKADEEKAKAEFNRKLENEFQELVNLENMDEDDIGAALENAFSGMSDLGKYEYVKDDQTGQFVQKTKPITKKTKGKQKDIGGKPLLETILEESDLTKN